MICRWCDSIELTKHRHFGVIYATTLQTNTFTENNHALT